MSFVTPTAFKLDLIQTLEELSFDSGEGVILSSANFNTIHPSINLQRGMAALLWFVGSHTSFNQTLKDLCLTGKLAHFVLTQTLCGVQGAGRSNVPPTSWNSYEDVFLANTDLDGLDWLTRLLKYSADSDLPHDQEYASI